jgi:hypothetical protein
VTCPWLTLSDIAAHRPPPTAHWPHDRLLRQITQERFTVGRGNLYEVPLDGRHHRADPPNPRDAAIGQLRRVGLAPTSDGSA